jgi:phosphomannomutase
VVLCKDGRVADLTAIFKAYDVRGLVPSQLDEQVAHDIGTAFAAEVADDGAGQVVIGHDMRPSSPGLAAAFTDGVRQYGSDAVMVGLASTDMLYFASGWLDLPGAMFTASHNPAAYNGIKLCRAGAVALSEETGLRSIQRRVRVVDPAAPPGRPCGSREQRDLLSSYAAYLNVLVPVVGRRLHVVVDAGNGMAGLTVPAVFESLDLRVTPLYFDLDGTFPNHEANPLNPANLVDLQAAVTRERADLGLAFDGDADRCFVVDEQGRVVSPSALAALIAVRLLAKEPGAHVIHNLITSRAVPETIVRHGGVPVRTKVGHSLIKATMAGTNAIFGGEHSGHFYFRDFWYADSGMLAALHLLAALAAGDLPVSGLVADYQPYAASGEINVTVGDVAGVLDAVSTAFAGVEAVTFDHLDGLTVSSPQWWFNVRPSNTEPVVRLNVEADDPPTMARVRDEVLSLVGGTRDE